ncbi:hypothetical protein QJS10_CPA06g02142 [Acorus calamus]|uniref:MADS box interactor-like n=1 Tax=Acorus calamus TaxID=4465 RepID=A0AAV9ER36_ACOCL|nr:hypothetical protein QJS10_CPA06g02142 [Acorus calamus]
MEVEVAADTSEPQLGLRSPEILRVKKRELKAVLEQCQRALDLLDSIDGGEGSDGSDSPGNGGSGDGEVDGSGGCGDSGADELCDLLKSRVESPNFLEKLGSMDVSQNISALSKTFSVKKRKGKLLKAWDGSKVIYNVASWGATAIGIYQNPAIIRAATVAFWTSCRVISKLI